MATNDREPVPVKPQGFGLETQTELPVYSPGYAATKGLSLHMQADGKGPLKGPGLQISGVVEGVEHRDGMTTVLYGSRGGTEAVSFPQKVHHEGTGLEALNPLGAVAESLKAGDAFGLRIGHEGHAVLDNKTQGQEVRVSRDGEVSAAPKDYSRQIDSPGHEFPDRSSRGSEA
jgi:hypothetical protein